MAVSSSSSSAGDSNDIVESRKRKWEGDERKGGKGEKLSRKERVAEEPFEVRGGEGNDEFTRMIQAQANSEEVRRAKVNAFIKDVKKMWAFCDNALHKISIYMTETLSPLDAKLHRANPNLACSACPHHCLPENVRSMRRARGHGSVDRSGVMGD